MILREKAEQHNLEEFIDIIDNYGEDKEVAQVTGEMKEPIIPVPVVVSTPLTYQKPEENSIENEKDKKEKDTNKESSVCVLL